MPGWSYQPQGGLPSQAAYYLPCPLFKVVEPPSEAQFPHLQIGGNNNSTYLGDFGRITWIKVYGVFGTE
jgi:hypothetical protein